MRASFLCYRQRFIFYLSALLAAPVFVFAATEADGDITVDTTWNKAGSPYVIDGLVNVLEGATLTIEPGVIVKSESRAFIDVYGTLRAEGTAADPIYFTSLYDDSIGGDTNEDGDASAPSPFDRWGIDFFGAPTSTLRNVDIAYSGGLFADNARIALEDAAVHDGVDGVLANDSIVFLSRVAFRALERDAIAVFFTDISVSDSVIQEVDGDAFGLYDGSILSLAGSRVEDIGFGSAVGLYDASFADIQLSTFRGGLDEGIELYGASSVWITESTVEGFIDSNITVFDDNRFPFGKSNLLVEKSILQNGGHGIKSFSSGSLRVTESIIAGNAIYGVFQNALAPPPVDARGNFWGDASGPHHPTTNSSGTGDSVTDNVLFDPWLTEEPSDEPPLPQCCSNVAFIPGLQATRLGLDSNRLWEPNRNADVETLYLDDDGNPATTGICTGGVIDEAAGFNIYKNFISFMDELVATGTIQEWKPFPYDWRYRAQDIVNSDILLSDSSTYRMADELLRLAETSPTGKVTLITHSNGGLVAKALISKLEAEGKGGLVDTLIMVAAPQLGTPKALAGILHGDEQTIPSKLGIVLSKRTARGLAENMPSAYELLPSERYFSDVFDPIVEFDEDVMDIYDFRALYGDAIESRGELYAFLLGDGGARTEPAHGDTDAPNVLDAELLADAVAAQAVADAWTAPAGMQVVQIAGWGLDTIRAVRYDDCDIPLCPDTLSNLDRELLLVHDGDGTVVIPSAVALEGAETYYVNLPEHNRQFLRGRRNREHADILEVEELQTFIKNLITGSNNLPEEIITIEKPPVESEGKKLRFRVHSPVSLDLYDAEGNHTGLIQNPNLDSDLQGIEQQIPNSYYLEFGETKYAGADTFATTSIVLIGQANGAFTFEIDEVLGDAVTASTSFRDIPVIEGARVTTEMLHIASSTVLSMDMDGDGVVDVIIQHGEGISTDELLDILRGVVRSLDIAEKKEKKLLKNIDKLEKALEKEYKNEKTAKKKTAHAFENLERTIEKFQKKGLLTMEEAEELSYIIEQIKVSVIE